MGNQTRAATSDNIMTYKKARAGFIATLVCTEQFLFLERGFRCERANNERANKSTVLEPPILAQTVKEAKCAAVQAQSGARRSWPDHTVC